MMSHVALPARAVPRVAVRGLALVSSLLVLPAVAAAGPRGQALPDRLTVAVGDVEGVGKDVRVVLEKRSVRSPGYRFYVQTPEGRRRAEPFPVSTYRGHVEGDPSLRVNGHVEPGGLLSANFSVGRDIIGHVTRLPITVPAGPSTPFPHAGSRVVPLDSVTPRPSPTRGGYVVPPIPMRLVRTAVNVAPECVAGCASLEAAVSIAEQRINDCDFNWARNVGLTWEIDNLVVEVAEPVTGLTWLEDGDAAAAAGTRLQGVTFCASGNVCKGGHAFVAGLGQEAGALMHEAGHAFGTTHGMDKADAMKGNRAFFGPNNTRVIVTTVKGRTEAEHPAVVYAGALPPQAQDDIAETMRDRPVTIDVLDNDFDGNGDALALRSVGECRKGGTATLNADKTRVIYTPPPGFVGVDGFRYEVVDATGCGSRAGEVDVNVITDGVAAHFDFEAGSLTQGELRGRGSQGFEFRNLGPVGSQGFIFYFTPVLVPGVRGQGVFNGINSGWGGGRNGDWMHQMNVADIGDPGPGSLTVSIWVLYPKLRQNMMAPAKKAIASTSGVIIGKGGVKYTGDPNAYGPGWAIIHLPKYQGFKFLGSNGAGRFDLITTEPIRAGTWYHLVMVMDRPANRLRAWVNNVEVKASTTSPELPPGDIADAQELRLLNGDTWQYWHSFPVVMDELKLFNVPLTAAQVAELHAEGASATPPDLGALCRDEKPDMPVMPEDGRFQAVLPQPPQ